MSKEIAVFTYWAFSASVHWNFVPEKLEIVDGNKGVLVFSPGTSYSLPKEIVDSIRETSNLSPEEFNKCFQIRQYSEVKQNG